jgi:hypothetical protein
MTTTTTYTTRAPTTPSRITRRLLKPHLHPTLRGRACEIVIDSTPLTTAGNIGAERRSAASSDLRGPTYYCMICLTGCRLSFGSLEPAFGFCSVVDGLVGHADP